MEKKTRKMGYEQRKAQELESIHSVITHFISQAQEKGQSSISVPLDQKEILELVDFRLKQAELVPKIHEENNMRLYILKVRTQRDIELDLLMDRMAEATPADMQELFNELFID